MLANLASLIWGSESTATPATNTSIAFPDGGHDTSTKFNIRAATPADEEEADWLLVDRAASPSSQPATAEREESPMREEAGSEGGGQVVEAAAAPRTGVAHRSPSLLQAIDVLRPAQKAQRRREERRLKRTPLERSNKARMVAAQGNKRAKRCDMMIPAKFSRAVNNRKC